jgi:class 3 adenylate cyclase
VPPKGEGKQVTVFFGDLDGSLELLADRDPGEGRQLVDPVLERIMAAVQRAGRLRRVVGLAMIRINFEPP